MKAMIDFKTFVGFFFLPEVGIAVANIVKN